jgi:arabinofuranosyltransferase
VKANLYKAGVAVCLLILLAGSTLHMLGGSPNGWGVDDAFISYRYARNLSEGQGLVFNPGERVEGYTNFLYVVLMAPAFWVTDNDGAYFFSFFLNLICAAVAFLLFVGHLRRRLGEGSALAGALLFALCLPLWVAVTWGLETPLVLAISIGVWLAAEQVAAEPTSSAISALCAAMVFSLLARADGFIIVGVALSYLLLKKRFRALAIGAAVVAVTAAVYEVWRYSYYGFLLPNTYYDKVAGPLWPRFIHAYGQLSSIAVFEGLLPFLVIIPFAWAQEIRKTLGSFREFAAGIRFDMVFPLVWLVYWFYIGGDVYWDRFLIILYPMGIFALLKYFAGNVRGKILAYVAVVLAAIEVAGPLKMDWRFHYQFDKYDGWIVAGKFLGKNSPGKTLATGALGKIPFFSNLYTEDMLGLADPVLAHRPVAARRFDPGELKFDPDYTLSRHPDLIANWITPSLDTSYGLTRAKYEKAGYRIGFLVATGGSAPAQSIVSVGGLADATIRQWIAQGYNFAILVRE